LSAESDLIDSFVQRWGSAASGIGDDAAVVDMPANEKLVVSTDTSVENVHFRSYNVSASEIGYRAAAAALSDLAAMAAKPLGLVFALVLPEGWRADANAIADGVGEAARDSACPIIGGNISAGGELSITTTVIGSTPRPLLRSGARAGDSIYVTGALGGSAAAVSDWAAAKDPSPECRERFVHPRPRIREALWLAAQGATSAIDLSDGIATDASHVAEASGVSFVIDVELLPISEGATLGHALSGGEDYELLITGSDMDVNEFQRAFGIPLTRIGSVKPGKGAIFQKDGKPFTPPAGFDHLSRK
jgi:thiamine-monophosphate kinase